MIEFIWAMFWVAFAMSVGALVGSFITYMAMKDER
jgi:hypothetical protein